LSALPARGLYQRDGVHAMHRVWLSRVLRRSGGAMALMNLGV
jgi:hypothetical protein